MGKITKDRETRVAPVLLSQIHAGQAVAVSATMRAEGYWHNAGRDGNGNMRREWAPQRWQATHITIDQGRPVGHPDRETRTIGPWVASMSDAEAWLTSRGIILGGGGYWRSATVEA